MPLVIDCPETSAISLDELVEHLFEQKIDMQDQEACVAAAPWLKRLGNNRAFLAEAVRDEIKDYRKLQDSNSYSSQVYMLYGPQRPGQSFFVRACFWPSNADQVVKASGTDPFFYYHPHDHNFNFLTVGYHGPGYWSDYYDYDYDQCHGFRGEDAKLRFVERSRIEQGKVMLYRAFQDIHNQLPADQFSVTLNVMENSVRASIMDQYTFDVEKGTVTGLINRMSSSAIFPVAAAMCGEEGAELLGEIARDHPLERVRLAALTAMASSRATPHEAIDVWSGVPASSSMFLREWRRVKTGELERLLA